MEITKSLTLGWDMANINNELLVEDEILANDDSFMVKASVL